MPKRKQYTIELKKKIIHEVEEGVKSSEVGRILVMITLLTLLTMMIALL